MNWDAFFLLHTDLDREGPGAEAEVLWALDVAGVPQNAQILDAGCGPGADTETLAKALPDATVLAVDTHAPFVAQTRARTLGFGDRVAAEPISMLDPDGPFDFIWCAGAAYLVGVEAALTRFRQVLKPGGAVAFSDAVWFKDDRPEALVDFWQDYADMTDLPGTQERIDRAGFRVLDQTTVSDAGWEAYYTAVDVRVKALRQGPVTPDLAEVLHDAETEALMWRQHRDIFGYALYVVTPK